MNSEKFYKFVNDIAGKDKILAESVIEAHKLIYGDSLHEGLRNTIGKGLATGALALGLAGGATPAHAGWFGSSEKTEQSSEAKVSQMVDEIVMQTAEGKSINEIPEVEQLVGYIKTLSNEDQTKALMQVQRLSKQLASFGGKNLNTIIGQMVKGDKYALVQTPR